MTPSSYIRFLAAEAAGLRPVKLNAVVVRGFNEDEVIDLASLTREHAWQMRFIEMMPFGQSTDFQTGQMISMQEMQKRIERVLGPLELVSGGVLDGEARIYRIPNSQGNIGFISSISAPFCLDCNRARLTSDGILRMCLLRENEIDLLTPLRAGASMEDLRGLVLDAVWDKPWGHGLAAGDIPQNRGMSEIGG